MITEYYDSGHVLSQIHYMDGVQDGVCRFYYDFGAWPLMSEVQYKKGKMNGKMKVYYENGRLQQEGNYKYVEGQTYSEKDGIWKSYYETGELQDEIEYHNGKTIKYKRYEHNGKAIQNMEGC